MAGDKVAHQVLDTWGISWMSLSHSPDQVLAMRDSMEKPPKVYVAAVSRVADREVQAILRHLNIKIIAIDECQVTTRDDS